MPEQPRLCANGCGKPARSKKRHGKYCGDVCRAEHHRTLREAIAARRTRPAGSGRQLSYRKTAENVIGLAMTLDPALPEPEARVLVETVLQESLPERQRAA